MTNIKILIVEDELIAAESLALDIKRLGYQVVGIVDTGEKAIAKIAQTQPELILMDIMLKGHWDGITTAGKILEKIDIPIIYLTAYTDEQTLTRAKKTSPYGYLVKPYKSQDLKTTIEMAINQYQKAQKMQHILAREKEIKELKSQALSTAAHDLRIPLTTILVSSEFLRDYSDQFTQDKKNRYFDRIKSAVNTLNQSLEDLLLLGKAEEGKIPFEPEEFNLIEFFLQLIEQFESILDEDYRFVFNYQSFCEQACLDKKLLRHILTNLLSNAIKYSPDGGNITLSLECDREQVKFQVQDEGIGIPLSYQKKLFQVFERGNNVRSIKGTGLGLSIVKKAVDLHQGLIKINSRENVGTTVIVTLPTHKDTGKND